MHRSWARDVNGRDPDETETRRWYVSRPSRYRDIETETTTLAGGTANGTSVASSAVGFPASNFGGGSRRLIDATE